MVVHRVFGFATAKSLLKEGWCVVINGRNEKVGQKAKTKLRRYSSKVQYIQGDVSKIEDCQRIVKETVDLFGGGVCSCNSCRLL